MTALALTLALVAVAASALAVVTLAAGRRDRTALLARVQLLETEVSRLADARSSAAPGPVQTRQPGLETRSQEFVITHLGEDREPDRAPVKVTLTGPAFADAVVRETVVQTASLVHGVRRALAPETRHRIRFEMKREIKRSRKDRKAEVKQALREHRARRRHDVTVVSDEEGAA